ncbi:phenylalanine--tRNA ligase subunit beta [Bordetella genomosp. 9]|uniref:phenylalanine--tRNA ligase subunit beta n=1 Tax=Bordetella genomosp. 9 TaxID=1416803 RepID=UPI000A29729B|nr:phenylalanine--tRNA ligase subunit beta [Bordetella genomosp. 9]ARP91078.1 phenylalanine--tRNA ligase subunit beta [Bordetella genomosp. 9]
MQFPESWLRTLVNPAIDTEELAHRLTMAGLEVEELQPAAPPFSGVVVAHIVEIAPHPNADKLRVCQVDDGSGQRLQIVCGAPNAAAGLKVPLARVGAALPGGMKIGMAKMRGVESAGMLCSARELGLSQDHAGLLELAADSVPGTPLREALDLDDTLITLKLTPNRADCLSILGVAREVAALTGAELKTPAAQPVPPKFDDVLPVDIQAPDLCGRFAGRIIRGVNARAATPQWMKTRLERAGQRSVSALVDISNYVMLELGRPTHVFDLDKISGGLTVRWAREGESLTLLNGQTIALDKDVGVIAAGDAVESLAGIMGGDATAVSLDTQNVYVEAAFWWPEAIAGRARRYKFGSEASHRFERGVDYEHIPEHLEFITRLIVDICGGACGPIDDRIVNVPRRQPVRMRLARCHRVLGIEVPREEVAQIFTRLGLPHTVEGDTFVVQPPSYRFDLHIEEDLIEEVARVHGFERIPARPPMALAKMRMQPETRRSPHVLRRHMAALDYQEVINFSFVEADWERDYAGNTDPIKLLNPIASQLAVMRSSLLGGLIANIVHNANRKQARVRVFELGKVFLRDADVRDGELEVAGVRQPLKLAGAAWGPAVEEQWGVPTRQVDFYDVKMDVEALFGVRAGGLRFEAAAHPALHPGRSARISLDGKPVGWLGELHPRWAQQAELSHAPVLFELDVDTLLQGRMPAVRELSRQPVVVRDLAMWVDAALPAQALLDSLAQAVATDPQLAIVQDVRLFDVWRDKSQVDDSVKEKSLAFRFWLQDTDATLDEARVADCLARLRDRLVQDHGARQRA